MMLVEMGDVTERKVARTIDPYVGLVLISALISAFLTFAAAKTRQWEVFEAVALIGILLAPIVYIGRRYKIFWSDQYVRMTSFGSRSIRLQYSDIQKVDFEVSVSKGRPFRRIAIYGDQPDQIIDISLKSFVAADIRLLVQEIHRRRPDLNLPEDWLKS